MAFPAALTWVYFFAFDGHPAGAQQAAYGIGKTIQFAFPAIWVLLVERRRLKWPATATRGVPFGVAFGAAIAGLMLIAYFAWLGPSGFFMQTATSVKGKLNGIGITTPAEMIILGVFYSLVHSLAEEYYWRWFVFGELRRGLSSTWAIVVSSLAFMAHHVIVLWYYLPFPWWLLVSLSVAVGGGVWAWLYERSGSLLGPWLSHLLIDAAIFAIGYEMAFGGR